MLSRATISSGAYLDSFNQLPADLRWSLDRIEQSLRDTLAARPHGADFWVFAYGSLIWNPLLDFAKRKAATLNGWRRSFCQRMLAGRASPDLPGRMLALEPGGSTRGVALQFAPSNAEQELRLLWIREMVTGAYRPIWSRITLDDGSETMAMVFVADPHHPQYQADSAVSSISGIVAAATGSFGSNADYVFELSRALQELGAQDAYVTSLCDALQRLAAGESG